MKRSALVALLCAGVVFWLVVVAVAYAEGRGGPSNDGVDAIDPTAFADSGVCLEGATVDDFEACFAATDPTSDKVITFQNVTGTVYVTGGTDVALADGGTNASLTAVNGGILYSTATAGAISAAGSSNQLLQSAGAATPTWTSTPSVTTLTDSAGIESTGSFAGSPGTNSVIVDNNGLQCGWPVTDVLADDLRIHGFSASPIGAGANLVGQDILIAAGQGSMTLVCTQANCGAGDTVSVVIDGTTSTCTRDAATDSSTLFTCGASDAAMCTNVAACLTQATGVAACAGAGCTLFTGVAGTAYLYRVVNEASGAGAVSVASSGNHAVAANGTDGSVLFAPGAAALPGISFIGDPDTGMFSSAANVLDFATAGTSRMSQSGSVLTVAAGGTISVPVLTGAPGYIFFNSDIIFNSTDQETRFAHNVTFDQFALALGDTAGSQFNIGSIATQDFDHADQANPTLYIHSNTAPDTNNTQWGSIAHNQTSVVADAGLGTWTFTAGLAGTENAVTGVDSLVVQDCGRWTSVTAGIDGATLTLPDVTATPAGCTFHIQYTGASAGALLDISPLDSTADGIYGSCDSGAAVVTFSGTDDADIGLVKATSIKGDWIKLTSDAVTGFYVSGCMGVWANN